MRDNDIKAPDGFLLGGKRLVRNDGTVLFQRGWWKVPDAWIGYEVWVHITEDNGLEAAPPLFHIYDQDVERVWCERTERPDARPAYRKAAHKAWAERMAAPR